MFRLKKSEVGRGMSWPMLALLCFVTAGIVATAWLTRTIYVEGRAISEVIPVAVDPALATVRSLQIANQLNFGLAIAVLAALLAIAATLLVIQSGYLASRRSLREVKMLASNIFASMIQGVVTTDCSGIITSINPRGCEILGVGQDCVGRSIATVSSAAFPLAALSEDVLLQNRAVTEQPLFVVENGYTRRFQADCHLLRDADGAVLGTALHLRDVTEHRLIEDRMRRMERTIGLGSLAVGLQHEIRNPLAALSLHVQLLEERLAAHRSSEFDELIGVLKTEVARLNGVLDDFRDFTLNRTLSPQPTDVVEQVDKAVRLVRPQADAQQVHISVARSEPSLPPVRLDPSKFEQVLLNLILNALEAMPDGGDLSVRIGADDGELVVDVIDTGRGIAPEAQPRIFDPYFTTKADGVGMGLAWSEKIVQQHHGHIEFETGSAGTRFRVTMPMQAEPTGEGPNQHESR